MGRWLGEDDIMQSKDIVIYDDGLCGHVWSGSVGKTFGEIAGGAAWQLVEAYRPSKGEHIDLSKCN